MASHQLLTALDIRVIPAETVTLLVEESRISRPSHRMYTRCLRGSLVLWMQASRLIPSIDRGCSRHISFRAHWQANSHLKIRVAGSEISRRPAVAS
jgi:hypothetical protein